VLPKLGGEANRTHTVCSDVTLFAEKLCSKHGGSDRPFDLSKVRDLKVNRQLANYAFCSCLIHPDDRQNCIIKVASKLFENMTKFGHWALTEIRIKS
jgi:hypothetical protein